MKDEDEVASLRTRNAELEAEVQQLKAQLSVNWNSLSVTAKSLTCVEHTAEAPNPSKSGEESICWDSWCPCCKRPIDIALWRERPRIEQARTQRFAYCAAIWGEGDGLSGFVLGALVLGKSLKQKSNYDLVLMHTDGIPMRFLAELEKIWILRRVTRIDADPGLFTGDFEGHRFDGVFTKLHALSLIDYDKVLMMDIDLVIFDSLDDLFDLKAPAAMRRGNSNNKHGEQIHGRSFFLGQQYDWLQSGGINAGVMLLEPSKQDYEQMLVEVTSERHPERVPGNGPEQDYLSRYYAPKWHHISMLYNFQIHHIFNALDSALKYHNGIDNMFDAGFTRDELEVRDGTLLRCIHIPTDQVALPVYETPFSSIKVDEISLYSIVRAIGRPIASGRYRVVPISYRRHGADKIDPAGLTLQPHEIGGNGLSGFVDLHRFEIVSDYARNNFSDIRLYQHASMKIDSDAVLTCVSLPPGYAKYGLPVFPGPDLWHIIGHIQLNETMVASGHTEVADGIPMIEISSPLCGYVDGRQVSIPANDLGVIEGDVAQRIPKTCNGSENANKSVGVSTSLADLVVTVDELEQEEAWMPERLTLDPKSIHIVHFSGELKMWDRDYLSDETDEQFVARSLQTNTRHYTNLFINKTGDISDYAEYGVCLKEGIFQPLDGQLGKDVDSVRERDIQKLITRGVSNTIATSLRAAVYWRKDLETLPSFLNLSSLEELVDKLERKASYSEGAAVDMLWIQDRCWYPGTVVRRLSKDEYLVRFDEFSGDAKVNSKFLRRSGCVVDTENRVATQS